MVYKSPDSKMQYISIVFSTAALGYAIIYLEIIYPDNR